MPKRTTINQIQPASASWKQFSIRMESTLVVRVRWVGFRFPTYARLSPVSAYLRIVTAKENCLTVGGNGKTGTERNRIVQVVKPVGKYSQTYSKNVHPGETRPTSGDMARDGYATRLIKRRVHSIVYTCFHNTTERLQFAVATTFADCYPNGLCLVFFFFPPKNQCYCTSPCVRSSVHFASEEGQHKVNLPSGPNVCGIRMFSLKETFSVKTTSFIL